MSDTLTAALTYAAHGLAVVPTAHQAKVPAFTAWQTKGTTDEATITTWWTGTYANHGVSILTGAPSGIFVLDVDLAPGGDDTLAELEVAHGPLPATHEVITGSGGRHLYFALPDFEIRNSASSTLGPGLDIRGTGGQVVAPPTIHACGTRYELEADAPAYTFAPAPGWLLDRLRPVDPAPRARVLSPDNGERPGDLWAATTPWATILTTDGWTLRYTDRDGTEHWTRPGKDPREGTSATVGYKGSDVLKVFTSSLVGHGLRAEETYTKLGYLAATRHDGNHSAAASALRGAGYHAPPVDLAAMIAPAVATRPAPSDPWPEPTPLPAPPRLPAFPLDALPTWMADHVEAAADAVQVPVDLTATLAIGNLAAAATGKIAIKVSGVWTEPMALYLVVAMRSGAGKSPAAKKMGEWLRDWQRARMDAARAAHDEAALRARILEKRSHNVEKSAEMGSADVTEVLAARVEAQTARDAVPPLPRLLIDDATPEAVAGLLKAYGERLALISTEAELFEQVMRGKPGARQSIDVYLKAWSGDPLLRDRKGSSDTGPEATELTNPLLTVLLTVQPSVLGRLHGDAELVSRGFASRFMFSVPADLIGRRDQSRRFQDADIATQKPYDAKATALADWWATWSSTATARFSPEAARVLLAFLEEVEPRLDGAGDLVALGEWANKLHGSVARYAGLLHIAEDHSPSEPISAATVARAIALGRYWLAHAEGVLVVNEDPTVAQAAEILEWVAGSGERAVSLSAMQKGCRRPGLGLDLVADYVAPVELLCELGWLRPEEPGDWASGVGDRGQKSPRFALWPSAVGNVTAADFHANHANGSPSVSDSGQEPLRVIGSRGSRIALRGSADLSLPPSPSHPPGPARDTRTTRTLHAVPDLPPDSWLTANPTPTDPATDEETHP